jgi:predicted transcriptional regulator
MDISHKKKREAARRMFLTNTCETNAEIARKLGLKPHTVARYRKEEDWDGLKLGINRNAARKMAEQLTNERVSLNVQHYTYFEVALHELRSTLKGQGKLTIREVCDVMAAVEKAQKGQRLAKGVGVDDHTEEQIRAEAQAQLHRLIDVFISAVKENVGDEQARERIRKAVLAALPEEPVGGAGDGEDEVAL